MNSKTINLFNFNYPDIKLNNRNVKVGTFFSGIGSPEMAFKRLKENGIIENYESVFFCEVDKHAIRSYCAIHDKGKNDNLGDITKINGADLPYCDIWIGGFPCQDISMAGVRRGFDFNSNTRSSLGWRMIQLLREVKEQPKVVIFENVAAITHTKMKKTLNLFKKDLEELGYLEKTHISSGRVPSELGYRYYVDELIRDDKLSRREMELIKQRLETKINDHVFLFIVSI